MFVIISKENLKKITLNGLNQDFPPTKPRLKAVC